MQWVADSKGILVDISGKTYDVFKHLAELRDIQKIIWDLNDDIFDSRFTVDHVKDWDKVLNALTKRLKTIEHKTNIKVLPLSVTPVKLYPDLNEIPLCVPPHYGAPMAPVITQPNPSSCHYTGHKLVRGVYSRRQTKLQF